MRALPSLVADDLVDLARDALKPQGPGSVELAVTLEGKQRPLISASTGLPVALDYAVLELLVEIRDDLRAVRAMLAADAVDYITKEES